LRRFCENGRRNFQKRFDKRKKIVYDKLIITGNSCIFGKFKEKIQMAHTFAYWRNDYYYYYYGSRIFV